MMVIADRHTLSKGAGNYTVDGERVRLIAIQRSGRKDRKGRDNFIYRVEDQILYNFSQNQPYWSGMGQHYIKDDGTKGDLIDVFATPGIASHAAFLDRYNYELV